QAVTGISAIPSPIKEKLVKAAKCSWELSLHFDADCIYRAVTSLRCPVLWPNCRYCFTATYVDVRSVTLLLSTTVNFFPSDETVIFATSVTLPLRLSVSSMVFLSTRFRETASQPKAPLTG